MRPPADLLLPLALGVICLAMPATAQQDKVGVAGAVNPAAQGQPPQKPAEQMYIGENVIRNERISTFDKGQVQLVFVDQSTLSIAPNSEIVIDEFVYDPDKQTGKMTATVTTGLLRYVGGKISKQSDVEFMTPSGAVSVRGGIALIKVDGKPSLASASGTPAAAAERPAQKR